MSLRSQFPEVMNPGSKRRFGVDVPQYISVAVALIGVVLCELSSASAQIMSKEAWGKEYHRIRQELKNGDYKSCRWLEGKMDDEIPYAGIWIDLAICCIHDEMYRQASIALDAAMNLDRNDAATPGYVGKARPPVLEALLKKAPRLRIDLNGPVPNGLKILATRNDVPIKGVMAPNSETVVDPGEYTIEVTAPGYKPWKTRDKLHIAERGKLVPITVKLDQEPAQTPPPTPPQELPRADTPTYPPQAPPAPPIASALLAPPSLPYPPASSARKLGTYISFGAGAAGIVAGTITGSIAWSDRSRIKTHCPDPDKLCDPPDDRLVADRAQNFATASTVTFVAGTLGVGAGLTLWLTEPKKDNLGPKAKQNTWTATVTPTAGGGATILVARPW